MIAFKGSHFEREVNLWGVRWYVAQGYSMRWNGQAFKQVIDARQSGAVVVLAEGDGFA